MNRTRRYALSLFALLVSTLACNAPVRPTESPWEPVPPEVAATLTAQAANPPTDAPADSLDTFEGFQAAVVKAVTERDAGSMADLMADEFTIAYWLSESQTYTPDIGASEILGYAKPEAELVCTEQPADLEDTLGLFGIDLKQFAVGGANIAGSAYCTGWGEEQKGAALLFIAQTEDGSYRWISTLLAVDGF